MSTTYTSVLSFIFGIILLSPIMSITIIIITLTIYYKSLPTKEFIKGWPIINADDKLIEVKASQRHSKPPLPTKRGWMRVSTTPHPIPAATLFEMIQDIMVSNWHHSTSFLYSPSKFLSLGKSISNLTNHLISPKTKLNYDDKKSEMDSSTNSIYSNNLEEDEFDIIDKEDEEIPNSEELETKDNLKTRDHRKYNLTQKQQMNWYYVTLIEQQLSLYRDESMSDLITILPLNMYDIGLYPFNLEEDEMFVFNEPILLAGHSTPKPDPDNPTTSTSHEKHFINNHNEAKVIKGFDINNTIKHTPNYYLFCENNVDKEEWYHLLAYHCRYTFSNNVNLKQNNITKDKLNEQGLLKESIKLNYKQLDPIYFNDLLAKIQGMNFNQQDIMLWINSFLNRIYFGFKDNNKMLNKIINKINNIIYNKLPKFINFNCSKVKLFNNFPFVVQLPTINQFNQNGLFICSIPVQYYGCLLSMKYELSFGLFTSTNYIFQLLNIILSKIKFNLYFQIQLQNNNKNNDPFNTDLIIKILEAPTRNLWLAFSNLPNQQQLKIHFTINNRSIIIPDSIINIILNRVKSKMKYPNFINVPFISQRNSTPVIETITSPLPKLIKTLTGQTNERSRQPSLPLVPKIVDTKLNYFTLNNTSRLYNKKEYYQPWKLTLSKSKRKYYSSVIINDGLVWNYLPTSKPQVNRMSVIGLSIHLDSKVVNKNDEEKEDDKLSLITLPKLSNRGWTPTSSSIQLQVCCDI